MVNGAGRKVGSNQSRKNNSLMKKNGIPWFDFLFEWYLISVSKSPSSQLTVGTHWPFTGKMGRLRYKEPIEHTTSEYIEKNMEQIAGYSLNKTT